MILPSELATPLRSVLQHLLPCGPQMTRSPRTSLVGAIEPRSGRGRRRHKITAALGVQQFCQAKHLARQRRGGSLGCFHALRAAKMLSVWLAGGNCFRCR
jgi:hypothetical protein